jgi:hypothetical protein
LAGWRTSAFLVLNIPETVHLIRQRDPVSRHRQKDRGALDRNIGSGCSRHTFGRGLSALGCADHTEAFHIWMPGRDQHALATTAESSQCLLCVSVLEIDQRRLQRAGILYRGVKANTI